jgi:hypothetical protein
VSSVDRLHPGTNTLERLQSPSRCGFEGGRPASRPPWE